MACIHKKELWYNLWCPVTCFYCTGEQERTCKHNKTTNADRIREMSDEELAEFIVDFFGGCPDQVENCAESCSECVEEWLKQPAEGE